MLQLQNQKNLSEIVELLVQYIPFVTITVLNAVLPIMFQKLVQFEDYRYEFGFKLTLARYACWFVMMCPILTYGMGKFSFDVSILIYHNGEFSFSMNWV